MFAMMHSIDLPRYLKRIGWDAAQPAPTLATLNAVARHHAASISFENLNPLLRLPVMLDPASLEKKMVQGQRGGYCFEQNRLLAEALKSIGFEVTTLIARVQWNRPPDEILARSHMVLKVELEEGPHIVDVGFGGLTLTGALALKEDVEQATQHEPFRVLREHDTWKVQGLVQGEWRPVYQFDMQVQHPIDYEVANHYTSSYPTSRFIGNLICARSPADRRLALLNRQFTVHRLGEPSVRRELSGSAEIREVLEKEFLLALPEHPDLDRCLDGLP